MEEIIKLLIDNKIISKDGIKVNGIGILIKKFDKMIELQDKAGLKLFYLEKRLEEVRDEIKNLKV